MAVTYEHVTFKDGETVRLRIAGENAKFLRGVEVRADGDEVSTTRFDQRIRIIEKTCIARRVPLRMSAKYGTLVRVDAIDDAEEKGA